MDTNNTESVDTLSDIEIETNLMLTKFQSVWEQFYSVVFTEDWKGWTLPEQIQFRNAVETFVVASNMLREKFDDTVWKGHSNGTVNPKLESIRKQREGDKPGKKAVELTPAQMLAKRLGK